ncbi:ABC transporter substrate-binding protein [Anaeromyxobacter diazotrophicus]|uniref:Myristoyl transferase n=1 Tax=Anaeromyxobacter diazotrophicus TaxID=2590199 RepID=A0A7I9VPU8_9BACT|nr:ABC transporter substrate-binding protein [Anaeromyxobacter diazotrophicus]GEJ58381.1 myristoyl transferase [Anaeromyxobacter diazotrophicus]
MIKQLGTALCLLASLAGPARGEDVVRLGNQKFVIYGAVSYMKELAPKYGLKIEERIYDKGIDMIPALNAGELDLAASAADAAVVARAGGAKTFVVAGFAKGSARLLARADLPLKKIADLKGKKVGVARGGAVELLLAAELAKHGMTWSDKPGRDVTVVYMPYGELNAGLEAKKVDAVMQSEPYASQAIHKGFGKEMLKPYDTELGEPVRVLVMTEAMYQTKPEVALRVMKCFVEATRAFKKDRKLAERFIREDLFKGQLTAEGFRDAMENAEFTYEVSPRHVQVTTDLMLKYGIGRMVTPPAATEWVKLDLLEKAKG